MSVPENLFETVLEARARLMEREAFLKGQDCPCCSQWVHLDRRKLRADLAALLVWMTRVPLGEWIHIPNAAMQDDGPRWALRGKDYSVLQHFDAIERSRETKRIDPAKRRNGYWRLTDIGRRFALGLCELPVYVEVYEAKRLAFSKETRNVHQALADRTKAGRVFDYRELMHGPLGG